MKVYLFTLHWNKKETLKQLKNSLIPALDGLNWEWIIKDNGSSDGSVEEIKSWNNPNINLIDYGHNKDNYAKGMNVIFDHSGAKGSDLIFTLNNDILIKDHSSLKKMIDLISNDNSIGQVGAKLNFADNIQKIQHCGVLFSKTNYLPFHYRGSLKEESKDRQNRIFPAVTGALSLTRADIYDQVRHSEEFHWCFEDIDFSMKVQSLNKKIVMCGQTQILHEESASLKKNPVNKMFMGHNSNTFLNKWRKAINTNINNLYLSDPNYNLYKKESK